MQARRRPLKTVGIVGAGGYTAGTYFKRKRYGSRIGDWIGYMRRQPAAVVQEGGGFWGRYAGTGREMKFKDFDVTQASVAAAGDVHSTLSTVATGNTENTRVGRKIMIKKIMLRYRIDLSAQDAGAAPPAPDQIKIILYCDRQCNGATIAVTDLLEEANYQSFNNLANKGRFRLLGVRKHTLNYVGIGADSSTSTTNQVFKHGQIMLNVSIPIEYNGTDGTIDEQTSNNIGLLLISANGGINLTGKARIRFLDS